MTKETVVVTIRLKDGGDLLAYYCGQTEEDEKSIILYRPIYIKQVAYRLKSNPTPIFTYESDLYSVYGQATVIIPFSMISFYDIASEFYTMYYIRNIGSIIAREETIQEKYIKFLSHKDEQEAMEDTDSILVRVNSEYLQ